MNNFAQTGWTILPQDPATLAWAQAARARALQVVADARMQAQWLQCEGTWFVGVDALPTDANGAMDGVALGAPVRTALRHAQALHRAQLSVLYPGYPRPRRGETAAAFGFRRNRDAAHVDGLLPGDAGARYLIEPHAIIVGLPLNTCDVGASPLVVWEGSHHILRDALTQALSGHAPADWHKVDIAAPYKAARRRVFDTCRRIPLVAQPGQAVVVHRLALHGIAPWQATANAPSEGRMVAYFRPQLTDGPATWLHSD